MPVSELSQHLDEVRDFESLHPDRANGIDFETAHLSRLASYALSAATCMSCLTNNPMPRLHAARIHEEVVKDGADTEAVREELTLLLDDMLKEAGKTVSTQCRPQDP
jgi:hypothetical protein